MSSSDEAIWQLSQQNSIEAQKFVKKDLVYILDSNSGSYQGNQIFFDSSTISNSSKWADYRESYFVIPFVIALQSSTDITGNAPGPFMCGLKSGYWHILDSMQVDLNGTNVVQLTPFINVWTSFKVQSSWSVDDQTKYGPSCGFWIDDATSFAYNTTANASGRGNGVSNNVPLGSFTALNSTSFIGSAFNNGFIQRLRTIGYTPSAGANNFLSFNQQPTATGINVFSSIANGGGAGTIYYWSILAKIRLKDVCDFFDKIPLTKGCYFRITLNVNTSGNLITVTRLAGPPVTGTIAVANVGDVTVRGRTNPIMVSPASTGNPLQGAVGGANGVLGIGCGVGSVSVNGVTVNNAIFNSGCRWYVPTYILTPQYEEQYIETFKTRTIAYDDVYNFYVSNQPAGAQFNNLLTNGIVNPKELLVVPLLPANALATGNVAEVSEIQSPFSTCPATTAPLVALQNFQVQVAGINLFMQQQQYDFDQYLNELVLSGINGGETTGLTSGLITEQSFTYGYRYYYANISRRLPEDDYFPKSVQISGTNVSTRTIDLCCFITYGRQIQLDTLSGAIISE